MDAATWLFVPGNAPHRFDKAAAAGADAVIIDLEDAVRPEDKDTALAETLQWLKRGRAWVRVNTVEDVDALAAAAGLLDVVVPKAENPSSLALGIPVVALIETAVGLHRVHDIAATVARLAFGSLAPGEDEIAWARQVLQAAEGSAGAVTGPDGHMIDKPVLDPARANQVFLGVQSDREWVRLCHEVLGRPDLAEDPLFARNPERVANDHLITPLIESAFATLDADRVIALLDDAGIASARLRRPAEILTHPQLVARDRWRAVRAPGGVVQALLPPVTIAGQEPVMGAVPRLGEHNDTLRAEFGS